MECEHIQQSTTDRHCSIARGVEPVAMSVKKEPAWGEITIKEEGQGTQFAEEMTNSDGSTLIITDVRTLPTNKFRPKLILEGTWCVIN